jgi:hypothetical protein
MCRLKEIRELREKIKKTAKIRQKSNTKKK